MANSLKKNYIFSLIGTLSGMLFPLITFPYAARVLMADGIGLVNFYSSIIQYITLFTCLGIPMYAIRETARVREDQKQLNKTTLEIILLHTGLTLIGYIIVFILCFSVDRIKTDIPLFLLLSTNIFFNAIGVEWFYQGTENFKYITIRGLIVKTICVIFLFIFVRSKADLMLYGAYSVIGIVGNNIFNFVHLRKYIHFDKSLIHDLKPIKHLKPALKIFVLNLIISIYVNLDAVMLGFLKDNSAVGYYTGATRLTKLLLGIASSLSAVMLPKLSNLSKNGAKEEFGRLAQKSVDFVMTLSFPIFIGLLIMAPVLIRVFCGDSYNPAISTLQILSPIVIVIALSNVFGIQILYPQGKEKFVIISTGIGAIINFILNLVLIPTFAQDGAAIATTIAESCVTFSMLYIGRKYLPINLFTKANMYNILSAIIMGIVCYIITKITTLNDFVAIVIIPIIGAVIYGTLLHITKNPFIKLVQQWIQSIFFPNLRA